MNITGVMPVLLLPFRADEGIDEVVFRKEIDFAIECGAAALCAPGFASEFYKLSDEERRFVIRVMAEQTARRVPVFAGTGCGSVRATVELSQYAESVGVDGLMVVAPKWCTLGLAEQIRFYEGVCRGVRIPVMLQDADFTGTGLPPRLFAELADRCSNFQVAKLETILPGAKCTEIIRESGGKLQVFYGLGGMSLLDGLVRGATGVMPGAGLIEIYVRVFELYAGGRAEEARALFLKMQPYLTFVLQHLELTIQAEKRVLLKRGIFSSDRLREPTLTFDETYQAELDRLADLVMGLCMEVRATRTRTNASSG